MCKTKYLLLGLGLSLLLLIASCSQVANAVVDGAVGGLSRAASERAANAVYKKMAPKEKLPAPATPGWNRFMAMQAQIVFGYSFAPGGLWVSKHNYKPGEYAKFEMQDEEGSQVVIEKAFLKKLDNGNEWWRVSWEDEEASWVYEGLLSPSEQRMLRLRAKDAEGNEGEIPVTENNVYMEPTEVTEESIEGAKIGEETITTPVGKYSTDHIRYMSNTQEGAVDWWLTPQVPGGVIQYQQRDENKDVVWTNTMIEKGDDATTILGSY